MIESVVVSAWVPPCPSAETTSSIQQVPFGMPSGPENVSTVRTTSSASLHSTSMSEVKPGVVPAAASSRLVPARRNSPVIEALQVPSTIASVPHPAPGTSGAAIGSAAPFVHSARRIVAPGLSAAVGSGPTIDSAGMRTGRVASAASTLSTTALVVASSRWSRSTARQMSGGGETCAATDGDPANARHGEPDRRPRSTHPWRSTGRSAGRPRDAVAAEATARQA